MLIKYYCYFAEDAMKSVDEVLATPYKIPSQFLTPPPSEDKPEFIDLTQNDIQDMTQVNTELEEVIREVKEDVIEVSQPEPVSVKDAFGGKIENKAEKIESDAVVQDENGNNSECTTPVEENKDMSKEEKEKKMTEEKVLQGRLYLFQRDCKE